MIPPRLLISEVLSTLHIYMCTSTNICLLAIFMLIRSAPFFNTSPKPSHFAQIIPQWCLNKTKGLSVTSESFLESSNFTPYVCYPLSTSTCIYVWWCFPPPLLHPSTLIKFWWCFSPSTFIRSLHVYYFGENFPPSTFIRSLHVY